MALTAKRISAGIYEVNGKRINATSSAAALSAYNKKYAPVKPTTPPKTEAPKTDTPKKDTAPVPPTGNAEPPAADTLPIDEKTKLTEGIDTKTPGLSDIDTKAIERAKAILGIGEKFGRGIADEFYKDGSLGRQVEAVTPEEQAALDQIKQFAGQVGYRTADTQNILNQQQSILDEARQLSAQEQEALNYSRAGLAGLNAPEMEGLRSQARAQIQGQAQQEARQLAKAQARGQVFGAAATAQRRLLGQDTIREGRNLERDLLVKNIDIKQAAQNAFNSLVTNTESNKASRTNAASNTLASTTLADESQRNAAKAGALGAQATVSTNLGDRLRAIKEFNLNQAAAEKAGQIGSIFGGIGAITDQRGLLAGEEFANQQYLDSEAFKTKVLKMIEDSLKKQQGVL